MPIAHMVMLQVAKNMASTAIACIHNPVLIEEAKKELEERLDGETFASLKALE